MEVTQAGSSQWWLLGWEGCCDHLCVPSTWGFPEHGVWYMVKAHTMWMWCQAGDTSIMRTSSWLGCLTVSNQGEWLLTLWQQSACAIEWQQMKGLHYGLSLELYICVSSLLNQYTRCWRKNTFRFLMSLCITLIGQWEAWLVAGIAAWWDDGFFLSNYKSGLGLARCWQVAPPEEAAVMWIPLQW